LADLQHVYSKPVGVRSTVALPAEAAMHTRMSGGSSDTDVKLFASVRSASVRRQSRDDRDPGGEASERIAKRSEIGTAPILGRSTRLSTLEEIEKHGIEFFEGMIGNQ